MAAHVERPIIFAFSNPRAGPSALPPKRFAGPTVARSWPPAARSLRSNTRASVHEIGQGNNVFVFPGVGLGCILSEAREVSDELFLAAARALADCVGRGSAGRGAVYPDVVELRGGKCARRRGGDSQGARSQSRSPDGGPRDRAVRQRFDVVSGVPDVRGESRASEVRPDDACSARDGDAAALAVPFDELPAERVSRVRRGVRPPPVPEGGDLYVTRLGWPWLAQLLPAHWYTDEWYARRGEAARLHRSRVSRAHAAGGRQAARTWSSNSRAWHRTSLHRDLLSRQGAAGDARDRTLQQPHGGVRAGHGAATRRLRSHGPAHPHAAPAGRSTPRPRSSISGSWAAAQGSFLQHDRLLAEDQENAVKAIELDIRRIYVLLYRWIKGSDAEESFEAGDLTEPNFRGLTPRVIAS